MSDKPKSRPKKKVYRAKVRITTSDGQVIDPGDVVPEPPGWMIDVGLIEEVEE